ncbi:MAG: acyl-CoA dehydrogenase family protein [bacterium]
MYVGLRPEHEALRDQLRAYFTELMTPALAAEVAVSEGGGPEYMKALKKMAQDGWLGIGWPTEYGGQGRSAIEQYIFADECQRSGYPFPLLTVGTVGPTIMMYGSDEQKAEYLPRILRGELHFCIGYSEPGAGTDLASLKTRAVKDEKTGEWVINGQKIFTSLAQFADYVWLAARTDPEAPKHDGITIFIVPTNAPGFRWTPIHTVGDVTTTATYYDDVRVPASAIVAGEGMGWALIVNQLNHERISLMSVGLMERLYEETLAWAVDTTKPDGERVIDEGWVQLNLARVRSKIEILKLLNWRQLWNVTRGEPMNYAEASTVKVYGSETYIEVYQLLLEVLGTEGLIRRDSPGALVRGHVERMYRAMLILTFGGGTNEIQRELIAMAGLAMPRSKR